MKIESMGSTPIAIDRSEVFKIATGSALTAENVLVCLRSGETEGWGNSSPNSVTKESTESILKAHRIMKKELEGREIDEFWSELVDKFSDDPAAVAGVDIALCDLKAKQKGESLFERYGGKKEGVVTDRTIGIMPYEDTIEHAERFKEKGFRALKIKVGLNLLEDVKRIKGVREEVGDEMDIWIDANQGYTTQEAITLAQKIADLDIEFIEQPVREGDLEGLKKVSSETDVPIMADEAMKDHRMAEKMCVEEIADMVNIKLMKCAGFTGGRKIVEVIEDYGVDAMVGCMGETIPSIAAGTHLHLTSQRIKYADLDSQFMLSDNIAEGLRFEDGRLWVSGRPGLGVDILKDKVERYKMDLEGNI